MNRVFHSSEEQFCHALVDSPGFFPNIKQPSNLLTYDLPRIHIQLVIIYVLTNSLHLFLFRHLLLPRIVSEVMVGVILGPTILGRIGRFEETLFPKTGEIFLNSLSRIGFVFFIFLWGVKMDFRMIWNAGWRVWILGIAAFMLPLISGSLLRILIQESSPLDRWNVISYVISAHSYVSFPVVASILVHLKIINTELGHLTYSAALITNIFTYLARIVSFSLGQAGLPGLVQYFFPQIGFFLYVAIIVRPLSYWVIGQTPGSQPVKTEYTMMILTLVVVTISLSDDIGVPHTSAAFLLGLIGIPAGSSLGSSLVNKLETVVDGLLAPLMVSWVGIKVNLAQLHDPKFIGTLWILVGCCLIIKVVSFLLSALLLKVPPRDSFTYAFVMSSEGIVQIQYHLFLLTVEIYDEEIFTVMVLSVLLFAAMMDVLAKLTYDYSSFTYTGYRKRTIEHQGVTGELSILPCIYHLDDAFFVRKLLQVSMPDEESPVVISVINMVELMGRATPQIIDHKFGQKETFSKFGQKETFSGVSRSRELLQIFIDFKLKYTSLVHIHLFSVISLSKFMHQDICSLAFKQSVSLIILPFHRKWNQQGKVILDSTNLRYVNCKVLDMAPCSVGVLFERHKMQRSASSSYNVGVIFIGGPDDIEALSYGKRMARSPDIRLTVVHLVVPEANAFDHQWDKTLDDEALQELNMDNIVCRDEVVKDGADTAWIVHALEDSCDLVLVGRRHEDDLPQLSGLAEWNEFPELGQIGDIMATTEIHKPLSVLVLQQQTIKLV